MSNIPTVTIHHRDGCGFRGCNCPRTTAIAGETWKAAKAMGDASARKDEEEVADSVSPSPQSSPATDQLDDWTKAFEEWLPRRRKEWRDMGVELSDADINSMQDGFSWGWYLRPTPKRESGWLPYPGAVPRLYEGMNISYPLLFHVKIPGADYVHQGFYNAENKCFYESGDDGKREFKEDVAGFMHYSLPPTADYRRRGSDDK